MVYLREPEPYLFIEEQLVVRHIPTVASGNPSGSGDGSGEITQLYFWSQMEYDFLTGSLTLHENSYSPEQSLSSSVLFPR